MDHRTTIRRKFELLSSTMSERARRLWAGAEADAIGHGGVAAVSSATGLAISTVRKGRDEVRGGAATADVVKDRRPGGGRPRLEKKDPQLKKQLEALVEPASRGDPECALRWTTRSTRKLARELTSAGHPVSAQKVAALLSEAGYSLQGTSKVLEGESHPDRDAQFQHINARATDFMARGLPVISVDSKKKEQLGEYNNPGREWQRKGEPVKVRTYDLFPDPGTPYATPYGVYDIQDNSAFVNVGTDHNTPSFAVHSIDKWWASMGMQRYPSATDLFITADAGGSNSAVSRVWKTLLQDFADRRGLTIHVSHFPPGTSKWNKIEHRLFSFITLNWRGRPLTNYETIVALIASTTTTKGLRVQAELDDAKYPIGVRAQDHQVRGLSLERAPFHGEWNYTLKPRPPGSVAEAAPQKPRRQQARDRMKVLIDQQIASGLNSAQFCKLHGINYDGFICARRKVRGLIRPNNSIAALQKGLVIRAHARKEK